MSLYSATPIEIYPVNGVDIHVKREDLCFEKPAPPFSKCRGIIEHLKKLKRDGYDYIGYTETSISMAGWGVAWACKKLELKCIIFDPQYKQTPEVLQFHRERWKEFDVEVYPIKAGMAKVNWYISKQMLSDLYPNNSILLPLGLPFEETIEATAEELIHCYKNQLKFKTIVVNVGSGTICAGIVRGVSYLGDESVKIYGVMGRTGNVREKREKIKSKAGLFLTNCPNLVLIDRGWEYTEKSELHPPFPCHAYYDAKAWEWLESKSDLEQPILFWNIGH